MDDIKWFIGFLVIIGIVWLSGKSKGVDSPSENATTTPKQTQAATKKTESPKKTPVSSSGGTVISEGAPLILLPEGVSPLQGQLSIGSVNRSSTVEREYVVIQASSRNAGSIDISGLTIQSGVSLGKQTIGKGWAMFYKTNEGEGEPILLRPGGRAYLLSGRSPLGSSVPQRGGFQLNLCTGFLEQGLNFYPSLPLQLVHFH